ncbi:hypothetical protein SO802_017518 [Lithocarpus litseifolius]|uniref:Uncharacterized protein n=1 Tax=Lithocarpus litseifolius TaxID=425828 RepID=A0AAW2CLK0_9ROSI
MEGYALSLGPREPPQSQGSKKERDEYLLKCLGVIASALSSSVVIEEIVKSPMNSGSSDSGRGQVSPAIEGFIPLVLALLVRLASSSFQEGTAIVLAILGFDPLILPKPNSRIFGVFDSKALKAILPSSVVINLKTFSVEPNLQIQEGVIIRMPKLFPYEDNHYVP